jgi:hypothetical protein
MLNAKYALKKSYQFYFSKTLDYGILLKFSRKYTFATT